jgi:type VI secretion system protein ImpJ
MDVQKPLYWHQGLFLQPQHFQLQDLATQSLLAPVYDYAAPHFWGAGSVDVNRAALGTHSFQLRSGAFLFPDGTYAQFPGNALLEPRSFEDAWISGGKPFPVYVGVRKMNPAGENVTVLEKLSGLSGVTTRFAAASDPESVRDLHSGGPDGNARRLSLVLRFFWESEREQLGDYMLLPVAQIERSGAEIVPSDRFAPPCLTFSAAPALAKAVREIRDQLFARARQLEEYKRQRGVQTAEFGSRDMVYLLALRSLNRYVPALFHVTEAKQVHPWAVYGLLRQLVGELSTFSERVGVMGEAADKSMSLPEYDHRNLYACFAAAQALVTQMLDEITAGPEYVIRLLSDGTYFTSDLRPQIFEGRNRFYLVLKTAADPKEVLASIDTVAKVAAREMLPRMIARALPGIGLEHLPLPPQELPRRANTLYFSVDHHSDHWAQVAKSNNIALYWDNAPEDLEAELMVVGGS